MGTTRLPTTMNTIAFFGLFFCFSLIVGPALSIECYFCVGTDEDKCDDANPGETYACSGFLLDSDYCVISGWGKYESRTCGDGNLADSNLKEGCIEDTTSGTTVRTCNCKGELCNETWKKAGWDGSGASAVYMSSLIITLS